jgi:phage shock protein PspC (stress-responsive transcriptional regulator)
MNASAPLHRATKGRMIGGVAAGLADYLGVDVTIVRIAFALAAVLGGGIGVPAYLAFLLLVPEEGATQSIASSWIESFQGGR